MLLGERKNRVFWEKKARIGGARRSAETENKKERF